MKKTLQLIAFALLSTPFARAQDEGSSGEPPATLNIGGYYMASFEYFNYGADGRNNIEFGWDAGKSEGARECARSSQVALKAALENLTKDGVDRLGLKEYGFDTIYLITADYDQVNRRVRDGVAWAWWSNPPGTERDGLIKFQGYYKNGVCKHPTEADLLAFAQAQIAKAKARDAERAAAPVVEETGGEADGGEDH